VNGSNGRAGTSRYRDASPRKTEQTNQTHNFSGFNQSLEKIACNCAESWDRGSNFGYQPTSCFRIFEHETDNCAGDQQRGKDREEGLICKRVGVVASPLISVSGLHEPNLLYDGQIFGAVNHFAYGHAFTVPPRHKKRTNRTPTIDELMTSQLWRIRALDATDSIKDLTQMLHRAYAPLAQRGLRYLASHQDADTTRARIAKGDCFVAVAKGIVGTITVHPPASGLDHGNTPGTPGPATCLRQGVATFGQYGIDPNWKGQGIGRALHVHAELHARALGATHIACDTAEPAKDLIEMYERWGYRIVERISWQVTNYDSVVLLKELAA
jgi:GNAT superfamily N-acetyltransferase